MKIKETYNINKLASVGASCTCPSCGVTFDKVAPQQAFCKSKRGTKCKDKYWNTVTPSKRCNTTRISPASAMWLESQRDFRADNYNPDDHEHPFSSEALGQW
jgi:hypothetical protein